VFPVLGTFPNCWRLPKSEDWSANAAVAARRLLQRHGSGGCGKALRPVDVSDSESVSGGGKPCCSRVAALLQAAQCSRTTFTPTARNAAHRAAHPTLAATIADSHPSRRPDGSQIPMRQAPPHKPPGRRPASTAGPPPRAAHAPGAMPRPIVAAAVAAAIAALLAAALARPSPPPPAPPHAAAGGGDPRALLRAAARQVRVGGRVRAEVKDDVNSADGDGEATQQNETTIAGGDGFYPQCFGNEQRRSLMLTDKCTLCLVSGDGKGCEGCCASHLVAAADSDQMLVCQSLDGTCCQRVIIAANGDYSSSLEPLSASGLRRGTNATATPRCTGIAPSKGCAKCAYGGRQEGKTIFDCTGSGLNLPAYNDGRRPFGARYTCADGSKRESIFGADSARNDTQSG
jgi:hypothetical protein